jgi:hypothetical protein
MCINAKLCLIATIDKSLQRKTHNHPAPATIIEKSQSEATGFFLFAPWKIPLFKKVKSLTQNVTDLLTFITALGSRIL